MESLALLMGLMAVAAMIKMPANHCTDTRMSPSLHGPIMSSYDSALYEYREAQITKIPASITHIVFFVHGHAGDAFQVGCIKLIFLVFILIYCILNPGF